MLMLTKALGKNLVRCGSVSRRRRRSAKTLIEAVVIISLLTIVVGLSTTTLAMLFRVRRQTQIDSEQAASLHRLAIRFRADAHDSLGIALRGDPGIANGVDLDLPNGKLIQYAFTSPNMTRQVLHDANVIHHETFRLSRAVNAAFEQPENSQGLIRLSIRPTDSHLPPRDIPRSATIEAVVGRSASLAQIARSP